ncbi:MAG: phosphodiester glycosidase family protein [bacterium]|nr:phosphodiester glycosidase family protein [bacterium]
MKKTLIIILTILNLGAIACLVLAYGPYNGFRNWFITTTADSWHHSYFAHVIYSDEQIKTVLDSMQTYEAEGVTDASQITFSNEDPGVYESIYEEQVLKRAEGNDLYKVIEISGPKYKGYVLVVYDPSRISLYQSPRMKTGGQQMTSLAKSADAIAAVNAGGFTRNAETHAIYPYGSVIMDGKLYNDKGGNLIGFNYDNVLTLTKESPSSAVANGMRDAVSFAPFLIVNGEPTTFKNGGGYGMRPRTAVGQRKDGIVLFIVIDGDSYGTRGMDMEELTNLFIRYGAYNAANLDGGGSSSMYVD